MGLAITIESRVEESNGVFVPIVSIRSEQGEGPVARVEFEGFRHATADMAGGTACAMARCSLRAAGRMMIEDMKRRT
jgi:hypothetical protein